MNVKSFEALANDTRRQLLVELLKESPQAVNLQHRTDECGGVLLQKNEQLLMHHLHIPKLVDFGLIEWDKEAHEISRGPQFEEIRPLLEFISEQP